MYQIQGQMGVCQLPLADFVIWTKKGISVERITFDFTMWVNQMVPRLREFYISGMVAGLFSRRIQRGRKL